jgi:bud emergence protein 1
MRLSDGNPQPRSSSSMGHSQQGHGPTPSVTRIPGASATSPVQRNAMPHTASSTTSFGRAVGAAMTPTSSAGYGSVNAPSQSATAPQPAYIKIKILDRHTDDMVAIRVPPRVTYEQLLDKVRSRFFAEISVLQYRVGQGRIPGTAPSANDDGREFGDVKDDTSLWDWLETHEKYVLYAE